MLFSVPGDPKHLLFAAKAELQYIQISIFLLDGISVHYDGRGGGSRGEGRAGSCIFIPKAGKPWGLVSRLPQRLYMKLLGPQEQKTFKQQPWNYPAHLPHV